MEELSTADIRQLEEKGISQVRLREQLCGFEKGFPFSRIAAPALKGKGVLEIDPAEVERYRRLYREKSRQERVLKFVPASGAATRMFKDLYAFCDACRAGSSAAGKPEVQEFFDHISEFAFYEDLEQAVLRAKGASLQDFLDKGDYLPVLEVLLERGGLSYGHLPKALLRFHRYAAENRTALEEHLTEAALYASCEGECNLHFTVSPEHLAAFEKYVAQVLPVYEKRYGIRYHISYSQQKSSTDTVAVNPDNTVFRDENGRMVFRPGGHGALIQNLNDCEEEIVFIKNIDNVTTDSLRQDTVVYKELLAGVLVERREAVFAYLRQLEDMHQVYPSFLQELKAFVCNRLSLSLPEDFDRMNQRMQLEYYKRILNRPMRVCGVVKNTGEPGGGPFWVKPQGEGACSLQIVESSQIDKSDTEQKRIFETAEFFNPVDLVCTIYDYRHRKFDLLQYVDPQTAFISSKSVQGKEIKAMELPGLWNGAMAHWITLFVEVPQSVFTPVKTVNDLLRPQHKNSK